VIVVAAAVIRREGKILVARRAPGKKHAGLWEFPGGKLEEGETPEQGLAREIREELGVEVAVGRELARATHAYDFGVIELITFECAVASGRVHASTDHDKLDWVEPARLLDYDLAPADAAIARAIAPQR
jgi:8-oxo-dGTP diphosphatase